MFSPITGHYSSLPNVVTFFPSDRFVRVTSKGFAQAFPDPLARHPIAAGRVETGFVSIRRCDCATGLNHKKQPDLSIDQKFNIIDKGKIAPASSH
jgi:hypothetical protein